MASCRLSSEIEGAKNRLSPVQQKSRIPVRIVNHLNNNSGKSSSSKDEVNMKQCILKNRLEKTQNKPSSRIPVPVSRTNSKDVGRDKIPKTVMITVTGKKPLGTITGINLPETSGKQAATINDATAKRLWATKQSSPEHATEPTLPVTRGTPMKQVTLFDTEQISTEEKNAGTENTKVHGDSVQPTDLVSECKANQEQTEDNIKNDDNPCGDVFSIRCDDEHKKELDRIEKGHSKIVEELQQWVEDGDKENKMLEEIIETTNEENVKLLVQISVMKKELKTLEKENNTLQAELKTKRTDVKNLRAKEHYNERELRNLKRDLKRKEQIIENALAEKQELLDGTDYLEGILRDSEEANEQLNVQVNELKRMLKEANKRPDYGHLREEVELLKGSLDVCFHKEKLINIQVEALTADASHVKASAFDETLALLEQVESQLDLCMEENARIMSEKDKELNELNDAKTKVIDDLNDQLAELTNNNARQISEKEKEFKKLIDEKSRFIDRLEDQLTQSESRNATIVSEKTKELNELKMQHLRDDIQLRDELAMSMKDYARIASANGKMMNQLIEKSRVIEALEDQLAKLKKENARVILDKNKEKMELNIKNARFIEQLEEQLAKLMRENCAIKGKEHARGETRNFKHQLQEMTFLLNITDSCSEANESKHQVCECREKFFAM